MKSISVLKPTTEVLNRIEIFFEDQGYRNISVNYKTFTLSAEKSGLFSRRKYVDVNIRAPRPVQSVIEMNVHSLAKEHIIKDEGDEEQLLHDKIHNLF
jgi:hypothetical protein